MKRKFRIFLLVWGMGAALQAAEPVVLWFTLLEGDPLTEYFIPVEDGVSPLRVFPGALSPPVLYSAGDEIQVWRNIPSSAKEAPDIVCRAILPTGIRQALVVIRRSGKSGLGLKVFDASTWLKERPNMVVLNLLPTELAARLGAEEVRVPPHQVAMLTVGERDDEDLIPFVLRQRVGPKWKDAFSTVRRPKADRLEIVAAYPTTTNEPAFTFMAVSISQREQLNTEIRNRKKGKR